MVDTKKEYGVDPMTFAEEMDLWKEHPSIAQTRNDKVRLHQHLDAILSEARLLIDYVKGIPEDDNEYHSQKVKDFTDEIESIRNKFTSCYDRHAFGEK